jgi:acyl-CoA synthetase (NDP forming)
MKFEKPVIVMKSNRRAINAKIAKSHTAALSANDDVADSATAQSAAIRVEDEDSLIDIICRVSSLMTEINYKNEIDLNPVIMHEKGKGVFIVGSRIFLR